MKIPARWRMGDDINYSDLEHEPMARSPANFRSTIINKKTKSKYPAIQIMARVRTEGGSGAGRGWRRRGRSGGADIADGEAGGGALATVMMAGGGAVGGRGRRRSARTARIGGP